MATTEEITALFKTRLEKDSAHQMKKAGDLWTELPLSFFYLTHGEDTVPIVVTSITNTVAEQDGIKIPEAVIQHLQTLVSPKTLVKDAVRLIFLTTFQPS